MFFNLEALLENIPHLWRPSSNVIHLWIVGIYKEWPSSLYCRLVERHLHPLFVWFTEIFEAKRDGSGIPWLFVNSHFLNYFWIWFLDYGFLLYHIDKLVVWHGYKVLNGSFFSQLHMPLQVLIYFFPLLLFSIFRWFMLISWYI